MHTRSSTKHLLLSALALAVIVGDAYFGRDRASRPVQAAATSEPRSSLSSPPPQFPAQPPAASPLSSAPEPVENRPAEKAPPAAPPSATDAHLSETLKSIEADYQTMAQPILAQSGPIIATEERTKLAFLDQEKLADLGKVLSSEELDVYQNHADPAAAPQRR